MDDSCNNIERPLENKLYACGVRFLSVYLCASLRLPGVSAWDQVIFPQPIIDGQFSPQQRRLFLKIDFHVRQATQHRRFHLFYVSNFCRLFRRKHFECCEQSFHWLGWFPSRQLEHINKNNEESPLV